MPSTTTTETTDPATPSTPSRADTVDAVATAVRAVPGVADLHGGTLGEVGTYLVGRRVLGVRLRPEGAEVHVSLVYGAPVRETAAAVRAAVGDVVPGPVDVTVEDVVDPGDVDPEPTGSDSPPVLEGVETVPAIEATPASGSPDEPTRHEDPARPVPPG